MAAVVGALTSMAMDHGLSRPGMSMLYTEPRAVLGISDIPPASGLPGMQPRGGLSSAAKGIRAIGTTLAKMTTCVVKRRNKLALNRIMKWYCGIVEHDGIAGCFLTCRL